MHACSQQKGALHSGDRQLRQVMEAYQGAVGFLDTHVGRLIRSLESLGSPESTAVVLTADHGEEFFEHGRWGHYQLYEENTRVPLLLWLPASRLSQSVRSVTSHLDLAPTILDLFGLDPPTAMLGSSMLPMLHGESLKKERAVYVESMWPDNYRLAIRTDQWKYLYESKCPEKSMLFNLSDDPSETVNLWQEESREARRFQEMRLRHEERVSRVQADTSPAVVDEKLKSRLRRMGYLDQDK